MHRSTKDEAASQRNVTDSTAAKLLALYADQIRVAIDEAFGEIDGLSRAVLDAARHANELVVVVDGQTRNGARESNQAETESLALQDAVSIASMRLQFADRLGQRLSNVSRNLADLATLMQTVDLPITETRWSACLKATRAAFTMEQERQMFDAIFDVLAPVTGAELDAGGPQDPILFD